MPRKNRLTMNDWSRIPAQPAKSAEGYETRDQFYAREEREARERAEEPIRKIVAETQETFSTALREHSTKIAKFWRNASVESLEDYIRHDDALVDDLGLPTTETPFSMSAFEAAITSFVASLPERGVTFNSDAARRKFALYAFTQADQGTVIDNSTLRTMLERCISLNIFGGEVKGELAKPQQSQHATVEPETFDDLASKLSTQSDAGNKALKSAAVDAALTGEVRAVWSAFAESLYLNFDGFVFTEKQKRVFHDAMDERRKNWLRPADYDEVRVALARTGELPSHLIYPSERISIDLETADLSKPEVRREFNRRERQLGA